MIPVLRKRDLEPQRYADLIDPPAMQAREREVDATVAKIVETVRTQGDTAVVDYTNRFDGSAITLDNLEVTSDEIASAKAAVPSETIIALQAMRDRITAFHSQHLREDWRMEQAPGVEVGQIVRPLRRIGVYCPGGRAAYPSTVLMTVLPAKVAGVREIIMVSPPTYSGGTIAPIVLAAADVAGVDRIFKTGGAQSISALAFGTQRIPAVDKIVGPGNVYVQAAKRQVSGRVAIDMEAGPSEVLIIADETANADYVASDLLGQAEHDPEAVAICVTDSEALADAVQRAIVQQLDGLDRKEIIEQALKNNSFILITDSIGDAIAFSNARAPEHLELQVKEPDAVLESITNAGSIFLGPFSPNAAGDYVAGPNHVLPTGGQARFASQLHTEDFRTVSSVIKYTREGLLHDSETVETLAGLEGFTAHAASVRIRRES